LIRRPDFEDMKGEYLSGECDAKQIARCKALTGIECEVHNRNNCPITKGEIKIKSKYRNHI